MGAVDRAAAQLDDGGFAKLLSQTGLASSLSASAARLRPMDLMWQASRSAGQSLEAVRLGTYAPTAQLGDDAFARVLHIESRVLTSIVGPVRAAAGRT